MKNIKKFLSSIYLGDRFCENVIVEDDKVLFQINCISRLKAGTEEWDCYSEEDIEHGYLVFDEVTDCSYNSELPFNDEIYEILVSEKMNEIYTFIVYGCNVSNEAVSTDVEWQIKARKFYIFNPQDNCIITE